MTTPHDRLKACLDFTLAREGGYQDRADDRGNFLDGRLIGTNFGISAPTLAAWVGPLRAAVLTAGDMRALPLAEARAIYAANYWNRIRGDHLPAGIDLMLFDFAVMAGPATSVRLAQGVAAQKLGAVTVDGFVGPQTLRALSAVHAGGLIPGIAGRQLAYLKSLDAWSRNPGWATRAAQREREALRMVRGGED